jgi:hypothetical protein
MLRLGCPLGPVLSMFSTLQKMQHFIGTTFGVSTTSFSGGEVPFQGLGQGNGAGPTGGWAIGSAPIINMARAAGYRATFVSAMTCAAVSFVCYAFVDDTDLVHTQSGDHCGSELIPELQGAIDHWEGGLRVSGGALVPSKSHWYLVDFKWRNGSWRYCSIADNPGELLMRDHMGNRVHLDRVEVSEAW